MRWLRRPEARRQDDRQLDEGLRDRRRAPKATTTAAAITSRCVEQPLVVTLSAGARQTR